MSLDKLTPELIDRIMCTLPCFGDLDALTRTSKLFCAVFKAHPDSIKRAVAYNLAGPALPQAVRWARHRIADRNWNHDYNFDNFPETADFSPPSLPHEVWKLVTKAADAAVGLEVLYSQLRKNRHTDDQSKLTPDESLRFRRAIFRLALFSSIFSGDKYCFILTEDDDQDASVAKDKAQQRTFLKTFSPTELQEMDDVAGFLKQISVWVWNRDRDFDTPPGDYESVMLCMGPLNIYEGYKQRSLAFLDESEEGELLSFTSDLDGATIMQDYLTGHINVILDEQGVKSLAAGRHNAILDSIDGENESCCICGRAKGLKLWGPAKYRYIDGQPNLAPSWPSLRHLLKGRLGESYRIRELLSMALDLLPPSETYYESFLQQLADYTPAVPGPGDGVAHGALTDADLPTKTWEIKDGVCEDCLKAFISDRLHFWIEIKRVEAGEPVQERCWWGYECNTQINRHAHADKLNHCWKQTGPPPKLQAQQQLPQQTTESEEAEGNEEGDDTGDDADSE